MDSQLLLTIGGAAGTVFGALWAAFERSRNAKAADALRIANGKDEIIRVKDQIIDAKEQEHKEYLRYREEHHKALNEANAKILLLTEDVASLRARTDISPIIENQRLQGEVTLKILTALEKLTYRIEHVLAKHEGVKKLP